MKDFLFSPLDPNNVDDSLFVLSFYVQQTSILNYY